MKWYTKAMRAAFFVVMALAVVVLLAGCGPGGTLQVKVPVPLACQEKEPDAPSWPTDALVVGDSLHTKNAAMVAEIEMREGYETKLRAALRACIRPISRLP